MKSKLLAIFIFLGIIFPVCGQNIEQQGREILNKSDLRLYPDEGKYELQVGELNQGTSKVQYTMQAYKKGRQEQTIVWAFPEVMKNNVSIRSGDTIYYKPLKATKPDIMSYQSLFMDSGFSWGDVVSSDIAVDYKTVKIDMVKENNNDCYLLQLSPAKANRYARIDVWIDQKNNNCLKRVYYSASGDKMKEARYTILKEETGKVVSFRIEIEDFFLENKFFAEFSKLKKQTLPKFLFDVQNIGRIHLQ